MVSNVFLVFVFGFVTITTAGENLRRLKREAEEPSELKLENELKRVKRLMENNGGGLQRVKRVKRDENSEQGLSRVKRLQLQENEPLLARVKRVKRSNEKPLPVQHIKDFDFRGLSRVKRLRRASGTTKFNSFLDQGLSRVKRNKRSKKFVLPYLLQVQRFQNLRHPDGFPNTRAKRSVFGPKALLKRAHSIEKVKRKHRKLKHDTKHEKLIHRKKKNLNRNHERYYQTLHPESDKKLGKKTAYGSGRNNKRRHQTPGDVELFRRRVQNRLHRAHHKNFKNHNVQTSKKHHVQSHRLNKKDAS